MSTTKKKAPMLDYIASNIKFLRTLSSLSQEQLAERIGLNRGNITSYERGIAKPSIDSLQKIADCFDVDLLSLIKKDLSTHMDSLQIKQLYSNKYANNESMPQPAKGRVSHKNGHIYRGESAQKSNNSANFEMMLKGLRDANEYQVQIQKNYYENVHNISAQLERLGDTMETLVKVSQEILKEVKARKHEPVS